MASLINCLSFLSLGGTVTQFDAMVLNGQEDEGFADHIVERMKEIGLKIFYPQIDLIAGGI